MSALALALALLTQATPLETVWPSIGTTSRALPSWIEREWRIRREALLSREPHEPLQAELLAADWRRALLGLEALRRMEPVDPAEGERLAEAARPLVGHAHPNVRAAALAALAALGVAPEDPGALVADPWPEVREELARACAEDPRPRAVEALALLARDPDGRVALAAERALCARDDAAEEARARLEEHERAGRAASWLAALERLARERGPSTLLRGALEAGPPSGSALVPESRAALLVAVLLARGEPAEVELLARGIDAPLLRGEMGLDEVADPDDVLPGRREALLLRGAGRGGVALGALLLDVPASDLERPQTELRLELALAALGADELVARALAREPPLDIGSAPWRALSVREAELSARLAPAWLAPERPAELRRAGAANLALGLSAGLVPPAELVPYLADADGSVARTAFEALGELDGPGPWLAAMHAYWRERPREERVELLAHLTRAVPMTPFLDDLLALGEGDDSLPVRGPSLVELLARFEGEQVVAEALERWLEADLGRLAVFGPDAAPTRALELRAQGLLRARARVGGAGTPVRIEAVLERSAETSTEVAKVAAALLGRTPEGRARLPRWLEPPAPERVRIEAALWLALECDPRAIALCIERWPNLDGELRSRVIERLSTCDDAEGLRFLERIALGSGSPRHQALAIQALVERARRPEAARAEGGSAPLAVLERVARETEALDLRRRAIEGLGDAWGSEALRGLWARLEEGELAEVGSEERALLREELLVALARAGGADELVRAELLARPLEAAESDLVRRFEGRHGTAVAFAWRGELGAAAALASRGAFDPALLADPPWWRLDGRLALALSARLVESAADAPAGRASGALALARAFALLARVALEGEAEAEDLPELRAEALARLAALARGFGAPAEEARWLALLAREQREERVDERALVIAFSPSASPGGGEHDTAALLAAARELDLGWRALARGDLAAARCALERAEPLAPGSARAALACADLAEATARAGNE